MSGSYDVIVIGSGIMGSSTAYQVAKRGKSVLLLEQYDFLHRRGSSHGESRTTRVSYSQAYYIQMMQEAYKLWEEAEQDAGYVVTRRTGQLEFGPKDEPSMQARIAALSKQGVEHRVLAAADEVRSEFPAVHLPDGWLALHTSDAGVVRASKAVAMFQALAAKHGAALRDNAGVVKVDAGWTLEDGAPGVRVETSRGWAAGRACVVAAGAWTSKLVKDLCGLELPIVPLHTSLAYWEVPGKRIAETLSAEGGFPTFATHGVPEIYGTPALEYPGLLKVSVHGGKACHHEERSLVPDVEMLVEVVSPILKQLFGGQVRWDAPALAEACMYSMTPDEDFILDVLPVAGRVVVAGGFSGHGFKFGPVVGRVMADLALTGTCDTVPLQHFSIQRFSSVGGDGSNNKKASETHVVSL